MTIGELHYLLEEAMLAGYETTPVVIRQTNVATGEEWSQDVSELYLGGGIVSEIR